MKVTNISKEQVLKNSFWKFSEGIGVQVCQLVITIVLARLLTPHDYGLMAIIFVATNFMSLFVTSSVSSYLVYIKDIKKEDFFTAGVCNMFVALFLVIILLLSAPYIAAFYDAPELTPLIRAMSVVVPFGAMSSLYNAYAIKFSMHKSLFYRNMISVPISGTLALVLAYLGMGIWALVCQQIVYNALLAIIIILTIKVKLEGKWRFDVSRLKTMWSYGIYTILSTLVAFISDSLSDLFIGKKINPVQLGYYNRGTMFPATLFNSINNVISNVLFPAFASYNSDIGLLKEKIRKTIRLLYSIAFPVLMGLIVCAPTLVDGLLTEKWNNSIPIIQIICLYFMIIPYLQTCSQVFLAVGDVKIRTLGEIIKLVLTIISLILLIGYGIIGVAFARVFVGLLMAIYTNILLRNRIKYTFGELLSDLSKPAVVSILMAAIIYPFVYLNVNSLFILSVQVALGICLYFIFSKLVRNKELLEIIKRIVRK